MQVRAGDGRGFGEGGGVEQGAAEGSELSEIVIDSVVEMILEVKDSSSSSGARSLPGSSFSGGTTLGASCPLGWGRSGCDLAVAGRPGRALAVGLLEDVGSLDLGGFGRALVRRRCWISS